MKLVFRSILVGVIVLSVTFLLSWQNNKSKEREFYQLTVYHFSTTAQEKLLDNYFQSALLPALHRVGVRNVGVFKSWANDTTADKLVYVFVPLHSLDDLVKHKEQLKKDAVYNNAASDYLNADPKNPAYTRMETIVLRAFPLAPQMQLPSLQSAKSSRVYELRSYESATEKKFESKVKMFNEGDEIAIFRRLNFNPIFYSEVVAGSKMPNLMYMTSFENRQDRDAHWKTFGSDSAWKKLSGLTEYQGNVSHIDINFLYPADYSDF
ncbi:MAG: NIPSNAP family protein [Flavisolibacter sp.]